MGGGREIGRIGDTQESLNIGIPALVDAQRHRNREIILAENFEGTAGEMIWGQNKTLVTDITRQGGQAMKLETPGVTAGERADMQADTMIPRQSFKTVRMSTRFRVDWKYDDADVDFVRIQIECYSQETSSGIIFALIWRVPENKWYWGTGVGTPQAEIALDPQPYWTTKGFVKYYWNILEIEFDRETQKYKYMMINGQRWTNLTIGQIKGVGWEPPRCVGIYHDLEILAANTAVKAMWVDNLVISIQ